MATLHIAWILSSNDDRSGDPGACIDNIISAEALTTSGTSANAAAKPAAATHAVVTSLDANHYVAPYAGAAATATNSVLIMSGSYHVFKMYGTQVLSAKTA